MIYLASPYTSDSDAMMEYRYLRVLDAVVWLATKGPLNSSIVYSPIVHWHEAAKVYDLPKDAKFWEKQNKGMLRQATGLYILGLTDWKNSVGCKMEFDYWSKLGRERPKLLSSFKNSYYSRTLLQWPE